MTDEAEKPSETPARPLHRIDLTPAYSIDERGLSHGHGRAIMHYKGENIGQSRQPLYAAARYLVKNGLADPADAIATYRDGKVSMTAIVGRVAELTVVGESPNAGMVRRAFQEMPKLGLKRPDRSPTKAAAPVVSDPVQEVAHA